MFFITWYNSCENKCLNVLIFILISFSTFLGCPRGWFGENCEERCDCIGDRPCHPITGTCSCPAGHHGAKCEKGDCFFPLSDYQVFVFALHIFLYIQSVTSTHFPIKKYWKQNKENKIVQNMNK